MLGFPTASRIAARVAVTRVHHAFVPLNTELGAACTDWQIRPALGDPMAFNDHTDWRWDERVLRTLASLDGSFGRLCQRLATWCGSSFTKTCWPP